MAMTRAHPHIHGMVSSNRALLALLIFPNIAWMGLLTGMGAWREVLAAPAMTGGEGPVLVGIGVFLALACPAAACCCRSRPVRLPQSLALLRHLKGRSGADD
jgi:hypothetical protein